MLADELLPVDVLEFDSVDGRRGEAEAGERRVDRSGRGVGRNKDSELEGYRSVSILEGGAQTKTKSENVLELTVVPRA